MKMQKDEDANGDEDAKGLNSFFFFFFDWKRHKDLLIEKKYKRRMRNPPAKDS